MDKYQRETIRGLFTSATIMLDQANRITVRGQSHRICDAQASIAASRLLDLVDDLRAVAYAVCAVGKPRDKRPPRKS